MESELVLRMLTHPYVREAGNFLLRYLLAQPVDLDFSMVILLAINSLADLFRSSEKRLEETLTVTAG